MKLKWNGNSPTSVIKIKSNKNDDDASGALANQNHAEIMS